jgi:precorrin-2 dehydrogenase/sirohydrochlorin ferrochelatase
MWLAGKASKPHSPNFIHSLVDNLRIIWYIVHNLDVISKVILHNMSYPLIVTDLEARRCVVIGGGRVAERKVRGLLNGGARPLVISPELTVGLRDLRDQGRISHIARRYEFGDLTGAFLAVAATNDADVNAAVAAEAQALGILINVVDAPYRGNVHTVATVRHDDVLLTVSTYGKNPKRAAQLRAKLEAWLTRAIVDCSRACFATKGTKSTKSGVTADCPDALAACAGASEC